MILLLALLVYRDRRVVQTLKRDHAHARRPGAVV